MAMRMAWPAIVTAATWQLAVAIASLDFIATIADYAHVLVTAVAAVTATRPQVSARAQLDFLARLANVSCAWSIVWVHMGLEGVIQEQVGVLAFHQPSAMHVNICLAVGTALSLMASAILRKASARVDLVGCSQIALEPVADKTKPLRL
jgi:hypothetical protein